MAAKPAGVYASAAAWVADDIAWQHGVYESNQKLQARVYGEFASEEVHQEALAQRKRLCTLSGHAGDRVLEPGEYHKSGRCKVCHSAEVQANKRAKNAAEGILPVVYATAEEFMADKASTTCEKHPELNIGYCPAPKEKQFHDPGEYAKAVQLRKAHNTEYMRAIRTLPQCKDRDNKQKRDKYAEDNKTEEGRKKLEEKSERDQQNKRARMQAPVQPTMQRCPVGPHDAPEEDFLFDPVADGILPDYKGEPGRRVHKYCKYHFAGNVRKSRVHNAKPERKQYNRDRETLERVKAVRKRWKEVNREHWNTWLRNRRANNSELREDLRRRCEAYQTVPENAYRIRVNQTKWSAMTRGIAYELSEAKEKELFSLHAECYHCGIKAVGPRPLGPDRLDPDAKAYTDDGTVSCCKPCNFARASMPVDVFHKACANVARYQQIGVPAKEKLTFTREKQMRDGVPFSSLVYIARRKNIVVEITKERHNELQNSLCYLCGVTGRLGVDRNDSLQGYTETNSFPCCTCCNLMKNKFTFDDFVAQCCRVAAKHQ